MHVVKYATKADARDAKEILDSVVGLVERARHGLDEDDKHTLVRLLSRIDCGLEAQRVATQLDVSDAGVVLGPRCWDLSLRFPRYPPFVPTATAPKERVITFDRLHNCAEGLAVFPTYTLRIPYAALRGMFVMMIFLSATHGVTDTSDVGFVQNSCMLYACSDAAFLRDLRQRTFEGDDVRGGASVLFYAADVTPPARKCFFRRPWPVQPGEDIHLWRDMLVWRVAVA